MVNLFSVSKGFLKNYPDMNSATGTLEFLEWFGFAANLVDVSQIQQPESKSIDKMHSKSLKVFFCSKTVALMLKAW